MDDANDSTRPTVEPAAVTPSSTAPTAAVPAALAAPAAAHAGSATDTEVAGTPKTHAPEAAAAEAQAADSGAGEPLSQHPWNTWGTPEDVAHPRRLRSFHPRRGRMSPTAAEALDRLAPDWGVVINSTPIDLAALVGDRPTVLEIGPGMGEATLVCAAADPTRCILAVDVHTPGLGRLLREADRAGLGNVRIGIGDAVDLLRDHIPTGWLDGVRIWFPDPWPKARHHKRRLIDPDFVALLADRVRPSGLAHLATDWPDYAEQMTAVLDAAPDWVHVATGTNRRLLDRPETGYERRAAGTGRPVTDLVFRRVP